MTRLLFAAALALLAACGSTPETPLPSTGQEKPKVKFEIGLEKAEVKSGEPVFLTLKLTNVSDAPLLVNGYLRVDSEKQLREYREVIVTILRENGTQLKFQAMINPVRHNDTFRTIKPGESIESKEELSDFYDLSKPGKYLIQACYDNVQKPAEGGEPFVGKVHSNTVTLKVVE